MTATSCEIWLVTESRNKDAVAARAIHNDRRDRVGIPPGSTDSTFGCERGAARPPHHAIQPVNNPNKRKPIDHIHPCERREKFGSMKIGYASRPDNDPALDNAYKRA